MDSDLEGTEQYNEYQHSLITKKTKQKPHGNFNELFCSLIERKGL